MYICVHEDVPPAMVPVLVAHSVLGADAQFTNNTLYKDWKQNSFRKVVLKVNNKEWNKIKNIEGCYYGYENTVRNAEDSCIILPIMTEYPNVIKFGKLWLP